MKPGVSVIGKHGAVIGGGELCFGPRKYDRGSSGVDYSGTEVRGVVFEGAEQFGNQRCLVLRNVRGLDINQNVFTSAGKGICVEAVDGNDRFHTTAMIAVSGNRFSKLVYGIYGDTAEWDRLSDWSIINNYFNYCSDTSVWIASSDEAATGGVDGLNFSGNTIFSLSYTAQDSSLFQQKRHNLRLGQTNWLRIVNNNFFESGMSAVLLISPIQFTFIGNHVAWPGQRELGDALEIRGGKPKGVIEGNTFADWTRAAVGMYDLDDFGGIEIGQNAWRWNDSPASWTGQTELPGYRIYASTSGGVGSPMVRDFQVSGAYDRIRGSAWQLSRDMKTPKSGIAGGYCRSLEVENDAITFNLSDIAGAENFGGILSITVTDSPHQNCCATYLLFVSSRGQVCRIMEAAGDVNGEQAEHPSFSWSLANQDLRASPIGSTAGAFNFDAIALGAVSPR